MATRNARQPVPSMDESFDTAIVLPDPSSFKSVEIERPLSHPGRVQGLDYTKWAVAIIDLNSKPDRIEAERRRIAGKGYQVLGGRPVVEGWASAEVWVIPREIHEQRLAARQRMMIDGIATGRYTESVMPREVINRGRG